MRALLGLKSQIVSECILVGFEIHNSESFNNIQYTNKATEPFLPFEVFGVSKEFISCGNFFVSDRTHTSSL